MDLLQLNRHVLRFGAPESRRPSQGRDSGDPGRWGTLICALQVCKPAGAENNQPYDH